MVSCCDASHRSYHDATTLDEAKAIVPNSQNERKTSLCISQIPKKQKEKRCYPESHIFLILKMKFIAASSFLLLSTTIVADIVTTAQAADKHNNNVPMHKTTTTTSSRVS